MSSLILKKTGYHCIKVRFYRSSGKKNRLICLLRITKQLPPRRQNHDPIDRRYPVLDMVRDENYRRTFRRPAS